MLVKFEQNRMVRTTHYLEPFLSQPSPVPLSLFLDEDQDTPIEAYSITKRPCGVCLIINNVNFQGSDLPDRRGSDIDAGKVIKLG